MVAAGLFGATCLGVAMVAEASPVVRSEGWAALLSDATFQHKTGELMIVGSLFAASLCSAIRSTDWIARMLMKVWPLMILGSALNLSAWIASGQHTSWSSLNRLWFMLLVLVGLGASPALRFWLGHRSASASKLGG
ncbi:MAG TPA: hypothetical protein VFF48_11200 [Brevundimonas sp.]|nr:hypothetical protein [Brevundimonas sp.]